MDPEGLDVPVDPEITADHRCSQVGLNARFVHMIDAASRKRL